MEIVIKRVRDAATPEDGYRVLVDRLWPRGLRREQVRMDAWLKDIAPSNDLRRWFGHDPERWPEFQARYAEELDAHPAAWRELGERIARERVTLLYDAKDAEHNNAVAIRNYLLQHEANGS